MNKAILAINAGSSSLKFGLFALGAAEPTLLMRGTLADKGEAPRLSVKGPGGEPLADEKPVGVSHPDMIEHLLGWIETHREGAPLAAVGHRIVHGGARFTGPTRLDDATVDDIAALTPLAPLHQPRSLEPVRALRALRPDLPQVACFDTAFHRTIAPPASRYAIPRRYERDGVRKYGFHGLSYSFIASRLGDLDPALPGKRTVVAHLGSGASLCAIRNGQSLDTTMGFSALDGLVMGTRPGALDPGVVLYLQRERGLSVADVEHMLYHDSGFLGVSEISADMRALVASDDPRARETVHLFAFRAAREVAALAATLEGLDALVFTGGIGEHDASTRAAISRRLAWLGLTLDEDANTAGATIISRPDSRVAAYVVPTDEERVIAREVRDTLSL